jgi:hypothetical protein
MPRAKTKPARPGPRAADSILLRLSAEEGQEIREAAKRDALPLGTWARSRLLLAARRPSPASATTSD